MRRILPILAIVSILLAAPFARADEPVKIRIGWLLVPAEITPILFPKPDIAHHLGKSYTVETTRFQGSPLLINALAANEIDVAPFGYSSFALAVENAAMTDLRIFADEDRDGEGTHFSTEYPVRTDGGIAKVEDLKGKIFATNARGSIGDIAARVMFKQHGLDPVTGVTTTEVAFPNMNAVLEERKADMIVSVLPFSLDPKLRAVAKVLFTSRDAMGPTEISMLTAKQAFLQAHRAAVVDFLEDYLRALHWYNDPANHDEVVKIVADFTKVPAERFASWVFTGTDYYRDPHARVDVAALQKNIDAQRSLGFAKSEIDAAKFVDIESRRRGGEKGAVVSEYDYIIVGAGSAGCVLANRLSADPRISVCVVEAGPSDRSALTRFKVTMPVGNTMLLSSPTFNWGYSYEGTEGLHHAGIQAPRGKLAGGSSSVNGMVYMRGHRRDYDGWAAAGNPGWSYDEVLPYFKKQENHEAGADDFHGTGGELNVARLRWLNPLTRAFLAAAGETQYAANDDFNGARQDGFGANEVTQKNGQRWSAARAFLDPAMGRRNLEILHGALTLRVRLEGKRAVGVDVRIDGATRALPARREVILASGSFNSPQILMLSGIGPGEFLTPHGIPVLHELPGVGRNLQDHAAAWVQAEDLTGRSFAFTAKAMPWLAGALVSYVLARQGPFTSNTVEAGGFVRTRPELEAPDIQFTFMPAMKDFTRWINHRHAFGINCCLLQPKSRGHIELKSADPAAAPVLRPRFLDHEDDVARLVAGVRVARQIMSAPAFAAARGAEIRPGAHVTTTAQIVEYLRENVATIFHPAGTCKMGPRADGMAVVDPRLKVHGLDGLRVIDASIMPQVTSGNTNAPTMMIAERGAEFVRADAR